MKITSRDHFIENKINFKLPSTSRNGNKRSTKEDEFCKQEDNIAIQSERKTHSRASSVTTYETILKNKQNALAGKVFNKYNPEKGNNRRFSYKSKFVNKESNENDDINQIDAKQFGEKTSSMPNLRIPLNQDPNANDDIKLFKPVQRTSSISFVSASDIIADIALEKLKEEDREKLRCGIDNFKLDYYEVMDDLVDDAYRCFKIKDRFKAIRILLVVINISVKIPEFPVLIKLLRIITQIFIYFRDWDSSIFCLEKLRDVCIMAKDYNTVMVAYKQAGIIFQHLKDYNRAIICFKKMLQFAWVTNSYEGEINAFEQLSLQYFYLGDLEKTKYHKRCISGKREKPDSYARVTALEKFSKEVQEIENEMGFSKKIEQLIHPSSRVVITIVNDLSEYK